MMWPDNRLTQLLGIDHPIIQAPMAGATTPQMAAAAANAGCLGSLGCAMMNPVTFRETYKQTRAATNRPINVNFFCHKPPVEDTRRLEAARTFLKRFYDELDAGDVPETAEAPPPFGEDMCEAVIDSRAPIVSFHFGLPDQRLVDALKSAGRTILCSATNVAEARDLENRGVDAIIAQGWEAGGHHGFFLGEVPSAIGTVALVRQICDAVSVPVVAAGGIGDGRAIVAALALGAAGVQIGTAFLTTEEAGIPPVHKQSLLTHDGGDTALTRGFSGRPARGIVNRYMREIVSIEKDLPDFPLMSVLTGPLKSASASASKPDFVSLWAGQAVGMSRQGTVAELIERMTSEAFDVMASFSRERN